MKRNKWLRAFGSIDDSFINEASPTAVRASRKKSPWLRIGALAACLCILIGANLWLFLPFSQTPPSVSRYSGSEYFEIIERLNAFAFVKPSYKNNFDRLSAGFSSIYDGVGDAAPPTADAPGAAPEYDGSAGSSESYVEVTDNQVDGVIEADIFKRSTSHIYHLRGSVLHVYSIAGEGSRELGSFSVAPKEEHRLKKNAEMYLSSDCQTVTVLLEYYSDGATKTDIISLDVSNPAAITERASVTLHGSQNTSRAVGDTLLALVNYAPNLESLDFSNEDSFLPIIMRGTERIEIPAESILYPDKLTNCRYTIALKLSLSDLSVLGAGAFLSYAEGIYATSERVYATRGYTDIETAEEGRISTRRDMTEICVLDYTDGIRFAGRASIEGSVLDQYSMDEHEGVLRIVTSTRQTTTRNSGGDCDYGYFVSDIRSASLYCLNATDMTLLGAKENFCPTGEEVTSARFKGNEGYVCTANLAHFTDPVYFFDLSNPENITSKDTGVIDGYSSSLVDFGEGYLLGIGVSDREKFKIEVYTEEDADVVSAARFVKTGYISGVYKSYYINRDKHLVGLAVRGFGTSHHTNQQTVYLLLAFDGFELIPILTEDIGGADISLARAFIDGGYFYLLTPSGLSVHSVPVSD